MILFFKRINPRFLLAMQFTVLSMMFGSFIPLSGLILLPLIWIFDRRFWVLGIVVPTFPIFLKNFSFWVGMGLPPLVASVITGLSAILFLSIEVTQAFFVSRWLKRKFRKKNPLVIRMLEHSK